MGERESTDEGVRPDTDSADELRTIGFRLREIQRMLAVRVEQENRRLEANGIEPVTDAEFFRANEADGTESETGQGYE